MGDRSAGQVDVLIVAALPEEFAAARQAGSASARFGVAQWKEGGPTPYLRGDFRTPQGRSLSVALTRPARMGSRSTAPHVADLVEQLRPTCLAMCGVCAGNPSFTALGDVVVAETVYEWDEGKLTPTGFIGDHRLFQLDERSVRAAQEFDPSGLPSFGIASDDDAQMWLLELLLHGEDPRNHPARNRYFPRGTWRSRLDQFEANGVIERTPDGLMQLTDRGSALIRRRLYDDVDGPEQLPFAVHVAPMVSGRAVISDGEIWHQVRGMGARKVAAVEMEAATIATIAHEVRVPRWLVVKGVMDHADYRKDDRYKRFAARASAEVLYALLDRLVGDPGGMTASVADRMSLEDTHLDEGELFRTGGGVGRPFGREDVLKFLNDRRRARTSVALLGPRRAGKTWILAELYRRLRGDRVIHKLTVPNPGRPVETPDELAELLEPDRHPAGSPSMAMLVRAEKNAEAGNPDIYLLDEIGRLNNYRPEAVSWLRDLSQAGAWIVYTGTEKDWYSVVRRTLTIPGSSFGNDVDRCDLGPWQSNVAVRFLFEAARSLDVQLDQAVGQRVIDQVGTWPFYVQVVGEALVRAARDGDRAPWYESKALEALIRTRLLDDWSLNFEARWNEIGEPGRVALLERGQAAPSGLTPAQRGDLRDAGVLRPGDEWIHDPPFFAWIVRNTSALRDRERRP